MRSRSPRTAVVIGLLISILAGCSGSTSTPIASSTTKGTASCAGRSVPRHPAEGEQSIRFGGVERTFRDVLPADYDAGAAVPLILQFHGFISNGAKIDIDTGLSERGTAQGFAVVTPDSLGDPTQWNAFAAPDQADDFGFVAALIGHVEGQVCIDRGRVAAAGHSNGAAFVGFLPCKVPHTFAAIAMASATIPPICPDSEQPSVYDRIEGGTHPWPGGKAAKADRTESEAGQDFDATGAFLTFFSDAPPLDP